MAGLPDEALAYVGRAVELDSADPYSHYFDALVKLNRGQVGEAVDALEVAVQNGYPLAMLAAEPILKELKQEPRFANLLATGNEGEHR